MLPAGSPATAEVGLVGYYGNFDESSEAAVQDLSGRGNNGNPNGARLIRGASDPRRIVILRHSGLDNPDSKLYNMEKSCSDAFRVDRGI